ncbi:MAG: DUF433 domain-containing protein [Pyrinomonadaceae bacterium]
MATATINNHIVLNDNGVPIINGTRTKVIQVVMDVKAHGWSPEEIHLQHSYLSMAQIHSALAYYWDNRETLERDIAESIEYADEMRERLRSYSIRPLLEKKGLI